MSIVATGATSTAARPSLYRAYARYQLTGIKRELKRRNAIEPIIGHTKADGLLERNHLAGATGDAINALLVAAGHNLRLLVAWLAMLLRALITAWLRQTQIAAIAR